MWSGVTVPYPLRKNVKAQNTASKIQAANHTQLILLLKQPA
jgi:hypothetical protein